MSQTETRWFDELTEDEKREAVSTLCSTRQDMCKEFISNSDGVDACLDFFSEQVFDKSEDESNSESNRKSAIEAFAASSFLMAWISQRLAVVSHEELLSNLLVLIPVIKRKWEPVEPGCSLVRYVDAGVEFHFPVGAISFATDLTKDLIERLEAIWMQRKSSDLILRLNGRNYKTPRQFSEDWSLPLREINRSIKKDWDFLEQEYGSIELVFPGTSPLILLSPKAQDYLKMFTPSGRPTRDTLMNVIHSGLG